MSMNPVLSPFVVPDHLQLVDPALLNADVATN